MINIDSNLWHPCTQMKDFETVAPLRVRSAEGICLTLEDDSTLLDVISSWWCKNLGHGHPTLRAALKQQADQLEHCMLACATHEPIEHLSQKLTALMPTLTHVTYASDGACAVEIAMKMSIHTRQIMQQPQKTKFAALKGAYHGETMAALSVSDLDSFKKPYASMLFSSHHIDPIPYVSSRDDPLWDNAAFFWERIRQQLDPLANQLTAILVEPILQAANSMRLYSKDLLKQLRQWCDDHDVHLIADEIMTGFGRTGKMFACEHATIVPDFLCLGKSLTAGWLPMSAVLTSDHIYQLFYADYAAGKTFFHSHTYAGNPLAARVALASLKIIEEQQLVSRAAAYESLLLNAMQDIADETHAIENIRGIGMVVAADLKNPNHIPRFGYHIYQKALQHGLLMRPLGDTVYWVLPLNIDQQSIQIITQHVIKAFMDNELRVLS